MGNEVDNANEEGFKIFDILRQSKGLLSDIPVPDNYSDMQRYVLKIADIAKDRAQRLLPHMVGGSRQAAIAQVGEAAYSALYKVANDLSSEGRAINLRTFDNFRNSVRRVVEDIGSLERLATGYCGIRSR